MPAPQRLRACASFGLAAGVAALAGAVFVGFLPVPAATLAGAGWAALLWPRRVDRTRTVHRAVLTGVAIALLSLPTAGFLVYLVSHLWVLSTGKLPATDAWGLAFFALLPTGWLAVPLAMLAGWRLWRAERRSEPLESR